MPLISTEGLVEINRSGLSTRRMITLVRGRVGRVITWAVSKDRLYLFYGCNLMRGSDLMP